MVVHTEAVSREGGGEGGKGKVPMPTKNEDTMMATKNINNPRFSRTSILTSTAEVDLPVLSSLSPSTTLAPG